MSLFQKTATELSELLKTGKCSSVEIITELTDKVSKENPEINGFVNFNSENALVQAKKSDNLIATGQSNLLTGLPVALKDNINLTGHITSAGSKMLANYTSPYSATIVEKMQKSGMVMLGKTNMDEFAIGTTGESSYYGATKNVWDYRATTGGSSSGSAAVVAAMQSPLAIGSDTGGSIRVPASYCGVVGFKPTYGAVSRYGIIPVASSFDQAGTLTRSVCDAKLLFDAIRGKDNRDATTFSSDKFKEYNQLKSLDGIKVAVIGDGFSVDPNVLASVKSAAKLMEANGAKIIDLSVNAFEHALSAYYIISSAEISSNMGRYDGARFGFRAANYDDNYIDMFIKSRSYGFGSELQKRIMVGTHFITTEQYNVFYTKAIAVKQLIQKEFTRWFKDCDIIITPTAPTTAFPAGNGNDINKVYTSDFFTAPINLAGSPAMSLPCGMDGDNLPIGMQFIANRFNDNLLLAVADYYEKLVGGFPLYNAVGGDK